MLIILIINSHLLQRVSSLRSSRFSFHRGSLTGGICWCKNQVGLIWIVSRYFLLLSSSWTIPEFSTVRSTLCSWSLIRGIRSEMDHFVSWCFFSETFFGLWTNCVNCFSMENGLFTIENGGLPWKMGCLPLTMGCLLGKTSYLPPHFHGSLTVYQLKTLCK